jgi:hypothetical protein
MFLLATLCGIVLGAAFRPPIAAVAAFGLTLLVAATAPLFRRGRERRPPADAMRDLERHLAWFRRRAEAGELLVVRVPAGMDAGGVRTAFRITDSVAVGGAADDRVVYAVLDSNGLERQGVVERLERLAGEHLDFAWARFPEDAVTLGGLVDHALEGLSERAGGDRRPAWPGMAAPRRTAAPRLATAGSSHESGGIG